MSSSIGLSPEIVDALRHLKERREINTVILRHTYTPGALALDSEGNLTHDELMRALPTDEARLVVHELAFATQEGARRHEHLLILWVPSGVSTTEEQSYADDYSSLKEFLTEVHIHLSVRRTEQLDYRQLVAQATG
ncbi:cofilin family protein [Streptomyces sp. NPDC091265]|uniref:cofilin family protein n=1 Tax=unclassified Streptomyces TaxID=2593676 RepID=UPI00344E78B9